MPTLPVPQLDFFDRWREKTGENEPDFSKFKAFPNLQPLLEFHNGKKVQTAHEWEQRKTEIKELLCNYFLGTFPERNPELIGAEIVEEVREKGSIRRLVDLTFDTPNKAGFTMEVLIPEGSGPFPVLMTQTYHRGWALLALSRGYIVGVYPGSDDNDQSDRFLAEYPEHDWTRIPRRAWLGSRALDYVLTMAEADAGRVSITGHSRNGKQALIAAAFDERFASVISSSSGSGGCCAFRYANEPYFQESGEFITRLAPEWFHPRLRYFSGRENLLPIDIHGLLGLIAPRNCLLAAALNDSCESSFAVEQSYVEGLKAYQRLGSAERLRILWRDGGHGTSAEDIHLYIDWLNDPTGFREKQGPIVLHHQFDWNHWRLGSGLQDGVPAAELERLEQSDGKDKVLWGLGDPPPLGTDLGQALFELIVYGSLPDYRSVLLGQDEGLNAQFQKLSFHFGDYVRGSLYYNPNVREERPVVIWLHPYSYPTGYTGAYMRGPKIYHTLVEQGYVVLAFDQIGFGQRIKEGTNFYDRYPQWSMVGKMVRDVGSVIDYITNGSEEIRGLKSVQEKESLPKMDLTRIYAFGYSLGGTVALYSAALDDRIRGVATFSGFTPMRTDTDQKQTGGIRRLWERHALLPRLGLFAGNESRLPYDYDDILRLIAPKHCLIVAPELDTEADHADVRQCVELSRDAWIRLGHGDKLRFIAPVDYNRFQTEQHQLLLDWLDHVEKNQ